MKPKQAAGLLAHNNKYLVHVTVKGVKGTFEKVIDWYEEVYANSKHLAALIENEDGTGALSLALNIVKSGLYSPNYDVAVWCCRLLSKLAYEFLNRGLPAQAWEWFTESEDGGLEACVYAIKKHCLCYHSIWKT
jgi:hypothetical protein